MMTSQAVIGYSRRHASGNAVSAAAASISSDACAGIKVSSSRPILLSGRPAWMACWTAAEEPTTVTVAVRAWERCVIS